MNNKIDIVVTYLDQNDIKWQKEYNKYKKIEDGNNSNTKRQSFGKERYRDWGTLKYWFRCVENNCKWVNKVFLIVAYESQIPKWLNTNNPKLRIVYHNEFIPKELLPTFNSNTIELFIPKIRDLSNNYILCCDDFYFISPIKNNFFFKDNIPVNSCKKNSYLMYDTNGLSGDYYCMLNNDIEIIRDYSGNVDYRYSLVHLPVSKSKSNELEILNKYYNKITNSLITSKFRNKTNYTRGIYEDSLKFLNKVVVNNEMYNNSKYITLKSNVDYNTLYSLDMICLNDTEQLDNFEITKKNQIDFFEYKFPNKSEYEN